MQIRGRDPYERTVIIAEVGANHNCNLGTAKTLIEQAAMAGADAVKFQLYNENLYSAFSAPKEHDLIKSLAIPYKHIPTLAIHAHEQGLAFICSVFCKETTNVAVPWCDALKIASSDNNDLELVKYVAHTELPVLISVGMATDDDLAMLVNLFGNYEYAFLACNVVYPTEVKDSPLYRLEGLISGRLSSEVVGFSDHSLSTWLPAVAVAMGAKIIEKHFTLDREQEGPDHAHSLMPGEFSEMARNIRDVEIALDTYSDGPSESEQAANAMWYKRSIHARKDIPKGKVIDKDDIIIQRPNDGLAPWHISEVLNQAARKAFAKGEGICSA